MNEQNSQHSFKGWSDAYLPIIQGDAPAGTVSLHALADGTELNQLIPLIASNLGSDARQAELTIIHYAIGAAVEILISVLALDGVTLEARSDQLGIVFGENGAFNAFWVAPNVMVRRKILVTQSSNQLNSILKPIIAAIHVREKLSHRGLEIVLYDAIWRGCRRIQNAYTIETEHGWIDELLITMGDTRNKLPRTFMVQADDGNPIEMTIPRVCCVLAKTPTPHACPTCPQHSDSDRPKYTETWLRSLDDDGFRAETGRSRVVLNCG